MVGTRNHPVDFQEPETATPRQDSPRKRSTRTSTANSASPTTSKALTSPTASSPTRASNRSSRSSHHKYGWAHTPSNLTLLWLAVSLPLVVWDTGYVLLRPLSMPGGKLHSPIWKPYALYGEIDYIYGKPALDARNGWTSAQGTVNALETAVYLAYLYVVYVHGEQEPKQGRGAPKRSSLGSLRALGESRTVYGKEAAWLVVAGFSVASLTFWKTVLYWLSEAFSGFANIGHNGPATLFFMWVVPNGAWLIFPAYMMYVFGQEILQGLEIATESRRYRS